MAGQKNGSMSNTKSKLNTSRTISPTLEELKRDLFIALEVLNGYTEAEALKNYECEQGTCQCP
jgi:hypothetical protein